MEISNQRVRRHSDEDAGEGAPPPAKKPKVPALASVIVEALKVDSLQRLCSSLEPLLRRIVSEEVERALTKLDHANLAGRSSPPRIDGPEGRRLQLQFKSRLPPHLFTGGKVEGEHGTAICVVLLDANTGLVIPSGPESSAKLNVVVLEGDFTDDAEDDWGKEHFESYEVKEREGKRPLLTGDLQVILKEGVGTLGELNFTDNSSWIRSRKFRLGIKVAPGFCDGVRVREAKSEAFAVKDHRENVWRLDRIAKDGALHKKLIKAEISTVEDFLRLLVRDPQGLRHVLGSGMSNRMWENTVEHAKTCVLSGKLYVYFTDETRSTGVVFNHICELRGLIADGQFLPAESLSQNQKVSVDSLVKRAYENWVHVIEYDGKFLLNSINSKNTRAPPPITDYNPVTDHYYMPPARSQRYLTSNPVPHFQAENNHSLAYGNHPIESPYTRSDPEVGLALATPQAAFTGNMEFRSGVTSSIAGTYTPGDWPRSRNGQDFDELFSEEDLRVRSSEMLETDDMQRWLKTFGVGVGALSNSDEGGYSYDAAYQPHTESMYGPERGRSSSGKAVVGWLKLKAALRWGIFVKQAAERRAQLVELD